ncbi:hypothetical protein LTS07_008755 [Exophiala sideris]|uniref:Protein kinase domain-containing protein n=1 Tax=Exophiala sideris TaxID=1016849 RepID=A0ABR0J1E3_9EURO|nr:hypothetical protein LTS07_008755 [Exophiala sideris]KAK5030854.1 hypothetical protein LTR13_007867 [Exophiala sideris]KAK5054197.1 hypothetical protein LTR69_009159 [Exophiala sideris]KAK5179447.1 hypothetical protein LTR44_007963 [Eurotiomycetes sp. CCFEE 6388]
MGIRPHHAELPIRQVDSESHHPKHKSGMWQKIHSLFIKDDLNESPVDGTNEEQWPATWNEDSQDHARQDSSVRPLAIGLPRQATFRRQNSERRERLLPVEPCHAERRAVSSVRRASTSLPRPRAISSPPHCDPGRSSAPTVATTIKADTAPSEVQIDQTPSSLEPGLPIDSEDLWPQDIHRPPRPPSTTSSDDSHFPRMPPVDDKADLRDELDNRWILNLSMHFRDKSDREKFFVTYAETPTKWRRVTISCDYRNAEPCSLEMDLKELQFQRDKSMQIYESIRDSLPEIQFYDTVTNLKLETTDGRLHVHVTEDVNEIIPYPPRNTVTHILDHKDFRPMEVQENELAFDSHLSGFVYKVRHKNKVYIKKEIPGPDTVDEFLYEINALHALHGSSHVIQLEALVLDDTRQSVRGLLISFAEKGAVVDLLYDHRGSIPWEDRSRWAEQAVRGLSEIHEEGFVQGDFTLSNIVVDQEGNAKIIDINRRGCPVGWEPPEIATKIASNQRISMYIGEKSDLYQLGMTLWALAMDDDEPERHVPPLSVEEFPSEVPEWYQDIVRICLADRPRDRLSAKALIQLFPQAASRSRQPSLQRERPALKLRTPKEYIDPADAVGRDDIERFSQYGVEDIPYSPESSRDDYTFTYPKSSNYEFDSETSAYDRPRGRAPPSNYSHLGRSGRHHWQPNDEPAASTDEAEPNIVAISPGMDREFDEVELDGHPYLVSRKTFNDEEMQILEGLADSDQATPADSSLDIVTPQPIQTPIDSRRRPSLHTANSLASDSTPRNSQSELPTLAHLSSTAEGSEVEAFGARKAGNLNREETNVQITTDSLSASQPKPHLDELEGSQSRPQRETVPTWTEPPRLPYADSGYDEPLDVTTDNRLEHSHLTTIKAETDTRPKNRVSAPVSAADSHHVSSHDGEARCKSQHQDVTSGPPVTPIVHAPSHQQSQSALPSADSGLGDDHPDTLQHCELTAA